MDAWMSPNWLAFLSAAGIFINTAIHKKIGGFQFYLELGVTYLPEKSIKIWLHPSTCSPIAKYGGVIFVWGPNHVRVRSCWICQVTSTFTLTWWVCGPSFQWPGCCWTARIEVLRWWWKNQDVSWAKLGCGTYPNCLHRKLLIACRLNISAHWCVRNMAWHHRMIVLHSTYCQGTAPQPSPPSWATSFVTIEGDWTGTADWDDAKPTNMILCHVREVLKESWTIHQDVGIVNMYYKLRFF